MNKIKVKKESASNRVTKPTSLDPHTEGELQQKIAAGSQDLEDYRNLADLMFAAGRYEEALSLYQRALNLPLTNLQKARVSMELGWLFYEMGRQTEALPLAQSAIELLSQEPEAAQVLSYRGSSQSLVAHCLWFTDEKLGADAARLALEWLNRATAEASDFEGKSTTYLDAARLQNLLANAKEAIALCEKCLQQGLKEADRLSCLIVYSEALQHEERFTEAEQVIQEALRYVKGYKGILPGLYLSLGLIQRFTNRLAEARTTIKQALVALQNDPYLHDDQQMCGEIYINLAVACYESGEYKEAAAAYQNVLQYHPEDNPYHRDALLWLGHCYVNMGVHANARECYEKVLASPRASDNQKASAREALAKLYYESGNFREAAAAFEEVSYYYPNENPHHPNILLWLGRCYLTAAANEKAENCFEKVLASLHASEADKASAQESLGELYYNLGDYKAAATAFEKTLVHQPDEDPNRWNTLVWLGNCFEATGAYAKAQDCFEKVLASLHALEADKALARRSLVRNLAKLYYESGNFREAAAAFEEALVHYPKDDPDRPNVLLWLGHCYFGTGNHAKARESYEELLASLQASNTDKASAQEGLARLPPPTKKTLH